MKRRKLYAISKDLFPEEESSISDLSIEKAWRLASEEARKEHMLADILSSWGSDHTTKIVKKELRVYTLFHDLYWYFLFRNKEAYQTDEPGDFDRAYETRKTKAL